MMGTTGLHLHDMGLAVASSGHLVSMAASVIHADLSNPKLLGLPAVSRARISPRSVSSEHWASISRDGANTSPEIITIARAELAQRISKPLRSDQVQCAVSAVYDHALETLLAIARLEGIKIGGFYDSAALAVSATSLKTTTLVLELGLSHVATTRVEFVKGKPRRCRAVVKRGVGLRALQQRWLRMISESIVLETRFDPLHDGESEQKLFNQLDDFAASLADFGTCVIEVPTKDDILRVEIGRASFIESTADLLSAIRDTVHELRLAGEEVNLLLDDSLLKLPGFLESLAVLRGCQLFSHTSGLVARAASLITVETSSEDSVTAYRGCDLLAVTERAQTVDPEGRRSLTHVSPTHVLYEGRAIALPRNGSFEIGRTVDGPGLRLSEELMEVSRLHCSLIVENSIVTLVPHTSHTTFLNYERVESRVRVLSGDRLRVGCPGVTIELIAVGEKIHGAPPKH